jgi:hypothetical protein
VSAISPSLAWRRRLVALIDPEHVASRRVAAKIGLHEANIVVVDGDLYMTYVS